MARRLMHILQSSVDFNPNDKIFFNFKKHRFTGTVTAAGLIHDINWLPQNSTTPITIFNLRTFESLTDWTETCIQEKLDEYHTRYSAWRRVRHMRTNQPMETIYKEYQRIKLDEKSNKKLSGLEQQQLLTLRAERILYLEKCVEQRDKSLKDWEEWHNKMHPTEPIPIRPQPKIETPEPVHQVPNTEQIQPFVLNSPGGAYIAIQRIKKRYPGSGKQIQELGLNGYKEMAKKFQELNKTYYPPTSTDWFKQSVNDINRDANAIASVVHAFFSRKNNI